MIERLSRNALAVTLAALFAGAGSPAMATDLMQAYQDAVANDAQFAVARSTVAAGREKTTQGRSNLMPTVNASASKFLNDTDSKSVAGGSTNKSYDTTEYRLTATQPLFRWQNWVGYQQGDLQAAQAEATFVQAQQDLILRVAEAYFNVLNAQESLKATQAQKTAIAQQLELAKKSFEVGTATITDTHEAQARYDLVLAQEIASESQLEVAKQSLNVLLGKDGGGLAPLKPEATPVPPQPAAIQDWVTQAEQNNTQVRSQQINAELAAKSSESARAGHYPTIDLVGSWVRSQNDLNKTPTSISPYESTTLSLGVQLNVPLFAGFGTESRSREASYQRDAALSGLDSARRQAALAARQAYLGAANGIAQVKALEAALVSSRSALEATKVGYEVGIRINNDVLNAEQQYYATQRDLHKAKLDALLALLRLKSAAGSLGEDDVAQVNALLAR
jgi:outer membrane protein